ncbi:MAG: cardiolipin synthase B [Planctomycetes bacterium]|nr:cardiolipin synthase B [Planctomycetota bacterium]
MKAQDLAVEKADLYTEAESTWTQLLTDISQSKHSVLFENYIWNEGDASDALIAALTTAKNNGATIEITIDAVGSFGASSEFIDSLNSLAALHVYNRPRFNLLSRATTSIMWRTHRRIVVCDNKCSWVGGLAIDDFWWYKNELPCRETMLRLTGDISRQLADKFRGLSKKTPASTNLSLQPLKNNMLRVCNFGPLRRPTFLRLLLRRIGQSQQKICIATAYFIPPLKLRRALIEARKRGVSVHLQLPSAKLHDHPMVRMAARRHYAKLLEHGVNIYEYTTAFQHSKTALFDDSDCLIGSPNIDRWSFSRNHELLIESTSQELCQQLCESFDKDMRSSVQIDPQLWKLRSFKTRLQENFAGIFDPIF